METDVIGEVGARGSHLLEEPLAPLRMLEHKHVQVRRVVAQPSEEGTLPKRRVSVSVALTQLAELPKRPQQRQRRAHALLARQRVQDHVDTIATRRGAHARGEGARASRREDSGDAKSQEVLVLGIGRGGGVDGAAGGEAEVHRREADASRGRMHEHCIAAADARLPMQRQPRRRVRHRTTYCLLI